MVEKFCAAARIAESNFGKSVMDLRAKAGKAVSATVALPRTFGFGLAGHLTPLLLYVAIAVKQAH